MEHRELEVEIPEKSFSVSSNTVCDGPVVEIFLIDKKSLHV